MLQSLENITLKPTIDQAFARAEIDSSVAEDRSEAAMLSRDVLDISLAEPDETLYRDKQATRVVSLVVDQYLNEALDTGEITLPSTPLTVDEKMAVIAVSAVLVTSEFFHKQYQPAQDRRIELLTRQKAEVEATLAQLIEANPEVYDLLLQKDTNDGLIHTLEKNVEHRDATISMQRTQLADKDILIEQLRAQLATRPAVIAAQGDTTKQESSSTPARSLLRRIRVGGAALISRSQHSPGLY